MHMKSVRESCEVKSRWHTLQRNSLSQKNLYSLTHIETRISGKFHQESEQSVNQLLKTDGDILLKYLLTRSAFSSRILSSDLRKLFFLNRGLELQSLG